MKARLAKLEREAAEVLAHCPGCVPLGALVLVPPMDGEVTRPAPAAVEIVRCHLCGRPRARTVIKVFFPGLPEPTAVLV